MNYTLKIKGKSKPYQITSIYFLLVSFIVVSSFFSNLACLNYIFKPLLMPVLIIFFVLFNKSNKKHFLLVSAALISSWLGDLFLMFETKNALFFVAGLSAFLIAHLFYIFVFSLDVRNFNLIKLKPYLPLMLLLYLGVFLFLLQPNLNELFLPVTIYAIVICTMLLFAFLRYKQVNLQSFQLSTFGALLFVLSDSVIAINKFLFPFEWAYPLIITLYATGQFYIVKGLLIVE